MFVKMKGMGMQTAGDALRQAFMSKEEYGSLRSEERAWNKLARPLVMTGVCIIWSSIFVANAVICDIVFDVTEQKWPSCEKRRLQRLDVVPEPSATISGDSRSSYLLTEAEAAEYFWIFVFLPTSVIWGVAVIYLFAGISVAYTAPDRHPAIKIVENNCCTSRRGGVRCLSVINISFFIVFAMLAIFLGSSILTLQTDCSLALFWSYEVTCWGTAILLAGCAAFLRRKAAVIMDAGEYYGAHSTGVELLEAPPLEPDYMIERRIAEGFRSWSGASDSDDDQIEAQQLPTSLDDIWEEDTSEETYFVPPDSAIQRTH